MQRHLIKGAPAEHPLNRNMPALQLEANWKPKYSDSDAAKMDEEYGKTSGSTSEPFDMDKLGEGAQSAGGWTMSDEYDAPNEEYGEDRPDADKVLPAPLYALDTWREWACSALDQSDPAHDVTPQ